MNKGIKIGLIAAVSAIVIGFVILAVSGIGKSVRSLYTPDPGNAAVWTAEKPVSAIQITDDNNAVEVIADENASNASVRYTETDRDEYKCSVADDGTLIVEYAYRGPFFNFNFFLAEPPRQKLTVTVPAKDLTQAMVRTSNGGITAVGLSANDMSLSTDNGGVLLKNSAAARQLVMETQNGRVELDSVHAGSVKIEADNAAITAADVTVSGALEAKTANGRITLSRVAAGEVFVANNNARIEADSVTGRDGVQLKSSNGAIRFTKLKTEGGDLTLSTDNGFIEGDIAESSDAYTIKSKSDNGRNNLPEDWGKGGKLLNAETANGSINVTFMD